MVLAIANKIFFLFYQGSGKNYFVYCDFSPDMVFV